MAFHNILSKLDAAIVAHILEQGGGTEDDTYPAKRDLDRELPNTVVISDDFSEAPDRSRCFTVTVAIHVRTRAWADSAANESPAAVEDASNLRVQQVFDCFYPEEDQDGSVLAAMITEAASSNGVFDFTCMSAQIKGGDRGQREKDGAWVDTLNLECYCAASTVGE